MLYTKKGDSGTTKLFDSESGVRLSKDNIIFELLGTLDEVNSSIGYTKALLKKENVQYSLILEEKEKKVYEILETIQNILFSLQAEVAGAGKMIGEEQVTYEESIIASVESSIPPIHTFLITGGDVVSAYLDVTRTIARRAERIAVHVSLQNSERVSGFAIQFLNRLSSVLYALARFVNHVQNLEEKPPVYIS